MNIIKIKGYGGYNIKIQSTTDNSFEEVKNITYFILEKNETVFIIGETLYYNSEMSTFNLTSPAIIKCLFKKEDITSEIMLENIKILLKFIPYILSQTHSIKENLYVCVEKRYGIKI